jgi:hypothetical protein
LANYAASQGGRVLVGHCYEAGARVRAYLPFIEVLRRYVLERDVDALRVELGVRAGEVARVLAELRDRLGIEPSASSGDPEEDRYRLLQGITDFLQAAAQHRPLMDRVPGLL